jgi:hypothetical protein
MLGLNGECSWVLHCGRVVLVFLACSALTKTFDAACRGHLAAQRAMSMLQQEEQPAEAKLVFKG